MKAPGKIYLAPNPPQSNGFVGLAWTDKDDILEPVEHIRKDALLELLKPERALAFSDEYERGCIVNGDLTLEPCFIARVGNCWAHGKTGHEALAEAEAKAWEDMPVETRIESFKAQFPSLDIKAQCAEFYKWHHILTGSCTMGRDSFNKSYGLEMDKEYTVEYFLEITSNAFGGQIIRQLKESYS